ncbi:hypothetical protein [Herpetosiphon geysericola]|uniref:Uncharacterized protein n=1 Tax=Herpetosiphon geysericola TaxID=70996 RepID=A0A0P6Y1V9_9CHLR|nr:hypothetical protein [Herpetosiphon geysericola]KPL85849.1 hypothetical protein SE18_13045 [Herpetosiphon geysericola]
MYQVPTFNQKAISVKKLLLQIGIFALINGFITNLFFWSRHHEGIFWSLSHQRISLIYAIMIVLGNLLFFINVIVLSMIRPTSLRHRLYSVTYLLLIIVGNDKLFWFMFGADFAQLYLSRVPIILITVHLVWGWRQFSKPSA